MPVQINNSGIRICSASRRAVADGVVLTANGVRAMGCGSLVGSPLQTVDVPLERRTWRLDELATDDSTAAVFSSTGPGFCHVARARFGRCSRRGSLSAIHYPAQPVMNVLALLDMPVRPFGTGCVIRGFACSSGTDTRERFPSTRGRLDPSGRIGVLAALRSLNAGDASAGELDARATPRRALPRLLARRPIRAVSDPIRTGPRTAALALSVPGRDARHRILGQFVRADGRWQVAATTECAIAVANRIPCTSGVPALFPGSVWLP